MFLPHGSIISFTQNDCNEYPHVAEGNAFLCKAVATKTNLAFVKGGTVH